MLGEGDFQKEVAIKLMNENLQGAEEMARRQRDEARVLGLVRHRAILQVDGLVRLNGAWAVVMEFIDGANLTEVLRVGQLPPRCALQVAAEVASALHVAYTTKGPDGRELKLLHRDIKPSNIQLSAAGEVKLLDFGIARADFESREAETVDLIMGTLRYMAPERLDGVDTAAGDIYALGVTLVEMLTGRGFKKTSSSRERHQQTLHLAVERLQEALGDDAERFRRTVLRALAYNPKERPTVESLRRECIALAEQLPPPRLAEWSEARIDIVKARRREVLGTDELSGATLVEQTGSEVMPMEVESPAPPASPLRFVIPVVGLVFLGSLVLTSVGLVALRALLGGDGDATQVDVAPVEERIPVVVSEPTPVEPDPTPELVAEPDPIVPAPVAPTPRPAAMRPAPSPQPVPSTPEPAPLVSAAPPMGKVVLQGDASAIRLVGPGGSFGPGEVAPGTYRLWATFDGQEIEQTVTVQVTEGITARIECTAGFQLCKVR